MFVVQATGWSPLRNSNSCKYLTRVEVTNILAYDDTATITAVKGFVVNAPAFHLELAFFEFKYFLLFLMQ
jgi:hypothetical protein